MSIIKAIAPKDQWSIVYVLEVLSYIIGIVYVVAGFFLGKDTFTGDFSFILALAYWEIGTIAWVGLQALSAIIDALAKIQEQKYEIVIEDKSTETKR